MKLDIQEKLCYSPYFTFHVIALLKILINGAIEYDGTPTIEA